MTFLVTGARGSVGRALVRQLNDGRFGQGMATDIDDLDVTDRADVLACVQEGGRAGPFKLIFHLAGAKHAPDGEVDPAHVARVNIDGTLNVLAAAATVGARVIFTSTCKACDPETAYGASKLIAERAVLNAGGVVCRFHNIPESDGNVFRLWESLPGDVPLPVTDCYRYFTPLEQAVELVLAAPALLVGRYCVRPDGPRWMADVAEELYPGRELVYVDRRRGDRRREPLHAECETTREVGGYLKIESPHDPEPISADDGDATDRKPASQVRGGVASPA